MANILGAGGQPIEEKPIPLEKTEAIGCKKCGGEIFVQGFGFRKIINTCQLNSIKGKLKVDVQNLLENDYKIKIIEILSSNDDKRNKYMKVRQALIDSKVTDFTDLYTMLYDKVDEYGGENTANIILLLGDGVSKSAVAIDKEIIAAATLIQILNII